MSGSSGQLVSSFLYLTAEMILTLTSSILALSLLTTSSALSAARHLVTWLMPPWPRTLRSSTSYGAPLPNASATTTVALSRGACMAVSMAVAATSAWGTQPSLPTGELLRRRWWWANSHRASPTSPHRQVGGASWWWSTATLRTGQRGTEQRRMRIWWWMMVPPPASTTCTTIRSTMACQGMTTLSTALCLMTSNAGQHGNNKMVKHMAPVFKLGG